MRHSRTITACAILLGLLAQAAEAGGLDTGLQQQLERAGETEYISSLVVLSDQADLFAYDMHMRQNGTPTAQRHQRMVQLLRETAETTQKPLRAQLQQWQAEGTVSFFEPFWVGNIVRLDAQPHVLEQIAARADVERMFLNAAIGSVASTPHADADEPVGRNDNDTTGSLLGRGELPAGLTAIGVPQVWNELGYTGEGVLVAGLDNGVDGMHPALASRWRGHDPAYQGNPQWAWYDPVTHTTFPQDFGDLPPSHGTHVTGTVVGGAPGLSIGVAPGAQWIHGAAIRNEGVSQTLADAILAFQWLLAPTGDPADRWAVPDVCVNSWGILDIHGIPDCDNALWVFIDNTEAAGVVQIFAAGNAAADDFGRPADRATDQYRNTAIGAVDPHQKTWPIASFSSTGPTLCTSDGSPAIKPDLAAPGVNVFSAITGGGYTSNNGTSMAAPHVAGVVALMRQACPDLTTNEIKQILFDTAVDLGPPGKDNEYGWGMIDAYQAVLTASQCGFALELPNGAPELLSPGIATSFDVRIESISEQVLPGNARLYWRYDGGAYNDAMLVHLGGDMYQATLPAADCGTTPEFYIEAIGDAGTIRRNPPGAPATPHSALVGSGDLITTTIVEEHFASGLPAGWTATGLWHVTTACDVAGGTCPSGTNGARAYFGRDDTCAYDTGAAASGTLTSSTFTIPQLPSGSTATITFCHVLQTEPAAPDYDVATFSIVGGPSISLDDAPQWTTYELDVTPFAGQQLQCTWSFDTIDNQYNDFPGWQIRNVRVAIQVPECIDPCADITGDNTVDVFDLLEMLSSWGACSCKADLDSSGAVDVFDLLSLLKQWGPCG